MRRIILFIASSLDGYIARVDGKVDWLFSDQDYGYAKFYDFVDTVLVGRKTYDQSLTFEERPYEGKKVYVFTRGAGKKSDTSDVQYVSADVVEFTRRLIPSDGGDIWLVGGGEIVSIFLNNGLIDAIILSVHPVVLGRGIPLFADISKQVNFRLESAARFDSGLAQLHYQVIKEVPNAGLSAGNIR